MHTHMFKGSLLGLFVFLSVGAHQTALAADACAGISCEAGSHCEGGACVAGEAPASADKEPLLIKNRDLNLLQPLNDNPNQTLKASPGIGIFFDYFNLSWPWILGVAAGIGVLQALIGGIQLMLSGSDGGKREAGKSKIMWALAGLLMVGLAGVILRSLNSIFYV